MFTKRIPLFSLFGFKVSMDLSWLILGALIVWSLAAGLFPYLYHDLSESTYWWMGFFGAIGLLFSIVVHELSHSLVARQYHMPIEGITLFIFGGVAEMSKEPTGPKAEFLTAIIGPITSVVLALLFYLITLLGVGANWPVPVLGVLDYLAHINLLLAIFNMVPAFPLDGGRVLRAALWGWKGRYRWATRIAANAGSLFGLLLILLALYSVLRGNYIGGIWWFLIGMFVRGAAQMSYRQAIIRQSLSGVSVGELMTPDPVTVSRNLRVEELVDQFFYAHYHKLYPVAEAGRLLGCVLVRDVRRIDRNEWASKTVGDIMEKCGEANTLTPDVDAAEALRRMSQSGNSTVMIVEDDVLEGVLSHGDIMKYIGLRMDLEEDVDVPGEKSKHSSETYGMQHSHR
jgi:Zn-dependent protease/CBS domain-containing protein